MYVPFSTYNFSLGDRIGSHWQTDKISELQDKINRFDVFNKLNTFEDFMPLLKKHPYYGSKAGRDIYFALTYYLMGKYKESSYFLDEIISLGNRADYDLFSYNIANALLIRDCIEKGDYGKGICQILQWQE